MVAVCLIDAPASISLGWPFFRLIQMNSLLQRLSRIQPTRRVRGAGLLVVYSVILLGSLWFAYLLRYEFSPPREAVVHFARCALWQIPISLFALWCVGQFRTLLSYFSVPDVTRIIQSQLAVCALGFGVWYATTGASAPPRSVLLMHLLMGTVGLVGFRLGLRLMRERFEEESGPQDGTRALAVRVAILGANDMGAHLIKEMKHRPDMRMEPIAVFDEDRNSWGRQIHGVPVLGSYGRLLAPKSALNLSEVIIADASINNVALRKMVRELAAIGLRCKVAPTMELSGSDGSFQPQIRPVAIEDLLGREPVDLQTEQIRDLIKGRCIVVSGAGGSIGSELCRNILTYSPKRLVLLEQCEVQLFAIEQELLQTESATILTPCVADILDQPRIDGIFRQYPPQIVFHAAAHKHVPLMEYQPVEAFQNNVIGTMRLAEAARASGCERFVLISTDKAINPTSVMGATKRLAEIYLQALQRDGSTRTRFMAVRFGNVLGSSGSVIPTFKRQISEGGPVTVTHPEVTRYFMVTKEAIGLVLQSAALGEGGEIFVLDMGTPVKIIDLARQMIELSGLRPGIDIEIKLTGLRPGEKLFEELNHNSENNALTDHPKIMRFVGKPGQLQSISSQLTALHQSSHALSDQEMKRELNKLVPEYDPYFGAPGAVPTPATESRTQDGPLVPSPDVTPGHLFQRS